MKLVFNHFGEELLTMEVGAGHPIYPGDTVAVDIQPLANLLNKRTLEMHERLECLTKSFVTSQLQLEDARAEVARLKGTKP